MNSDRRNFRLLVFAGVAVIVLAGASTIGLAAGGGAFRGWSSPSGRCSAPSLAGTVVDVTLADMGGPMMRGWQGGGMMRIWVESQQVPAGTVSFRVANAGNLVHELVVLPLRQGQNVGQRIVRADNKVGESGSLGEASNNCGAGAGDGIDPGGIGWVTLHLDPGSYELICNLPGHYAAGMYARLTVT